MSLSTMIRPAIIAHRGACGYLPEHTLTRRRTRAYSWDADYIEQDVVLTSDGVPTRAT